jgi:hypothetical protein
MKSVLQSQKAGVELAISGAPNAELPVMLLTIKLSKRFQLVNLGIAVFDFGVQRRAKFIHLTLILCGENLPLPG